MLSRRLATLVSLALLVACAPLRAQNIDELPPVPPNPNEIVTRGAQILMTPAQRAQGLGLLAMAGQNYTFGQAGRPDTTLAVELQSSGGSRYEGEGSWQETWTRTGRGWWSNFAGVTNNLDDDVQQNPVPMRVAMSRMALLWPVDRIPSLKQIRVAQASFEGKPVTCVLLSRSPAGVDAVGRGWREAEYCLDSSGLLRSMSPAPGVYFVYDYSTPVAFAGHTIAANISVIENETKVLQIHVARLEPPSPGDLDALAQLHPARGILAGGFINVPARMSSGAGYRVDGVVIVHATVSPDGRLIECEVPGGDSALAQAAVQRLQGLRMAWGRNAQREFYARVELADGQ